MWTVRKMQESDWQEVREIYLEGMETNLATFETVCPPYRVWDDAHLPYGRLVVCGQDGQAAGWTALSPISGRC